MSAKISQIPIIGTLARDERNRLYIAAKGEGGAVVWRLVSRRERRGNYCQGTTRLRRCGGQHGNGGSGTIGEGGYDPARPDRKIWRVKP